MSSEDTQFQEGDRMGEQGHRERCLGKTFHTARLVHTPFFPNPTLYSL